MFDLLGCSLEQFLGFNALSLAGLEGARTVEEGPAATPLIEIF
jgi:hypothetical protein